MMDDIIANSFDHFGNKIEMTMRDCYKTYIDMLKLLYHDYMIKVVDSDFDGFKKIQLSATEKMMDLIHNKYADHVEGLRMELFKEKKLHDPRRNNIDG